MLDKIAVIGAGPMGLVCAYELLKKGHAVEIFERDSRIGGMTASFDLGGLKIERFYHFICATDFPYFKLLGELGLSSKLRWRSTRMGFYYKGKLYPWSNPLTLLAFPHLSLAAKIRYSAHILYCKRTKNWRGLDRQGAVSWLKKWLGAEGYTMLWDNLLRLKYYDLRHEISAAWIASRIQRIARSRKSLFDEQPGYLEGGSDTLLDALEAEILRRGGKIHVSAQVEGIGVEGGQVRSVRIGGQEVPFDRVVSTIPLPYVPRLAPMLSADELGRIARIRNVGVVCVVFRLKHSFSENFWTNINDERMELPGIIEYSNLYPMENAVVYLPYYMPQSRPEYGNDNDWFIARSLDYMGMMNPQFSKDWVLASHVSRYHFAQPVCTPGFFASLPPMRTSIRNFVMADTAYYYPEDRSISESARLGCELAELAVKDA